MTETTFTYDLPDVVQVEADGPVRIIRLNRPDDLNASNHELHEALAALFPQLDADADARAAVLELVLRELEPLELNGSARAVAERIAEELSTR